MRKTLLGLVALAMLGLAGCGSTSSPDEIVMASVEPWNTGDVEAAMAFYADDTLVTIGPAVFREISGSPAEYRGKAELRSWFQELEALNFELELDVLAVDGDTVTTSTRTWIDMTRDLGVAPLVATEVYTVENGKISGWTWTLSDESLADIQAAVAALQPLAAETRAAVVFDGETCAYGGPASVAAGTRMIFEFDDSAYPGALNVGHVRAGTTWEEIVEYTENTPAGSVPPFIDGADVRFTIGSGSLEMALDQVGAYAIECATGPRDTNTRYAGGLIEVVEG